MFCQHCGNANQQPDSYCVRCGEWLAKMSTSPTRKSSPEEIMSSLRAFSGINALMALCAAFIIYFFHAGNGAHWSIYVAGAFCCVIAVHQLLSFYWNHELQKRLKKRREIAPAETPLYAPPAPQALPEAHPLPFVQPRSVTEHTTDLLEAIPRRPIRGD